MNKARSLHKNDVQSVADGHC